MQFILTCMALAAKVCLGLFCWLAMFFIIMVATSFIVKYYYYCKQIKEKEDNDNQC